jgi:hypothetical protein
VDLPALLALEQNSCLEALANHVNKTAISVKMLELVPNVVQDSSSVRTPALLVQTNAPHVLQIKTVRVARLGSTQKWMKEV